MPVCIRVCALLLHGLSHWARLLCDSILPFESYFSNANYRLDEVGPVALKRLGRI